MGTRVACALFVGAHWIIDAAAIISDGGEPFKKRLLEHGGKGANRGTLPMIAVNDVLDRLWQNVLRQAGSLLSAD